MVWIIHETSYFLYRYISDLIAAINGHSFHIFFLCYEMNQTEK